MTDRVEINPEVMQGKPVIRGTRIPVELLLRKLSEGATIDDLLAAYPRLIARDISAALDYAANTIAHENLVALAWPQCASSQTNAATTLPSALFVRRGMMCSP
jgi:uncharacterized protein (DUF433 family)